MALVVRCAVVTDAAIWQLSFNLSCHCFSLQLLLGWPRPIPCKSIPMVPPLKWPILCRVGRALNSTPTNQSCHDSCLWMPAAADHDLCLSWISVYRSYLNIGHQTVNNRPSKASFVLYLCQLIVSRLFWRWCIVCCLSDDIHTAALSVPSVSDIDAKLKLLRKHNIDKWVAVVCFSTSTSFLAHWPHVGSGAL